MPIRFRCGRCHQLMGIARRKAGTTVNCPTCHTPVVVPLEDEAAPAKPPMPAVPPMSDAPAPLFERSDFEAFLHEPHTEKPFAPQPPPPQPPAAPPSLLSPEPLSNPSLVLTAPAQQRRTIGLVLSPTQATWLTVLVILLVAIAFGAGLLVGYYLLG